MRVLTLIVGATVALTTGCGDDESESAGPDSARGQALYAEPHEDGNTFACSTCHALEEPAADGFIRPGHPIGDAAARASFKNGQLSSLLDAVNTCRTDWLGATAFTPDDARWLDLEAFLASQVKNTSPELVEFQIVEPPASLDGGDHIVGEDTFNHRCIVCHGESGVGTERAPTIAGTMLSGDFIGAKVRRSGNPDSAVYPDLIPGRMPFWGADRLSDDELLDIAAFLAMSEPPVVPVGNQSGDRVDLSLSDAQTGCGSTHAMVGSTLTFETIAHSVAGTATVVDDCTIDFDGFSFDGGGIDVRVIGGAGGNYAAGASLSINLVGEAFTMGEARVSLPGGVSLDDFDGLSIWCVPVGFSFGDGTF